MGRVKTKNAGERKTVMLNAKAFAALKHYSDVTNINLGAAASRAIEEWMEVTGAVHIEALTGKHSDVPVAVPAAPVVLVPPAESPAAVPPLK